MKEELRTRIARAAAVLKEFGAREVYVFGSAATGAMRAESDVDLAVAGLPPEVFFKAMVQAADALGRETALDILDLDEETLEWGRKKHIEPLGRAAERVSLVLDDVRSSQDFRPEVVAAMNFSYFTFKERPVLLDYFRRVHRSLRPEGVFFFDIYGGPESQIPQEEETEHDDFSYVWDQDYYDPVTGDYRCFIHVRFPDGSEMRKAYSYDWRLWTLTEVQDLLREAGFSEIRVYWEGTDEDGGGHGVFRPVKRGDDAISWISCVAAFRCRVCEKSTGTTEKTRLVFFPSVLSLLFPLCPLWLLFFLLPVFSVVILLYRFIPSTLRG